MSTKPKPIMKRKLAYFEDRGSDLKTYSLLLAAYYGDFEKAKSILAADPEQLNVKDPYAGLTALHIAIFRQNKAIIELLLAQREIKLDIKDGFGRTPVDMLGYTVNQEIFEMVLRAAYPDEMRSLDDEAYEQGRIDQTIIPFKPDGPK